MCWAVEELPADCKGAAAAAEKTTSVVDNDDGDDKNKQGAAVSSGSSSSHFTETEEAGQRLSEKTRGKEIALKARRMLRKESERVTVAAYPDASPGPSRG